MWQPMQLLASFRSTLRIAGRVTILFGVASEAASPEVGRFFFGCGQYMRIVAGNASEPALTGAEAAAVVHLLDLAGELVGWRAG